MINIWKLSHGQQTRLKYKHHTWRAVVRCFCWVSILCICWRQKNERMPTSIITSVFKPTAIHIIPLWWHAALLVDIFVSHFGESFSEIPCLFIVNSLTATRSSWPCCFKPSGYKNGMVVISHFRRKKSHFNVNILWWLECTFDFR